MNCEFLKSFIFHRKSFLMSLGLLVTLGISLAFAGTWRVLPIRLVFDQRVRSGVITVTNDSDEEIVFSVASRRWTQDEEGNDVYESTSDLLVFPKQLTIEPGKERVIRVGVKVPAIKEERTYRIFIKQESSPEKQPGTNIALAIRFGVPIFSKPAAESISGKLSHASIIKGQVEFTVSNTGNSHFRIGTIDLLGYSSNGDTIINHTLPGHYVLAGVQREFTYTLPQSICAQLETLEIQAATVDNLLLNGKINVDEAKCLTQ